ncbi:MAG: DUF1302 domain-containing protein [Stenotrophobium sp.]
MNTRRFTDSRHWKIATLALAATMSTAAFAADLTVGSLEPGVGPGKTFRAGDATLVLKGVANVGTMIRAQNADPALISVDNGGTATGAPTSDDGDLNYGKNQPVSTAITGFIESDLDYKGQGMVLSLNGWYDYVLEHDTVPHGNAPNAYIPDTRLSDDGFAPMARFGGVSLADAFLYSNLKLGGGQALLVRVGNQVVPWVTPTTIQGGIEQVNPINIAARGRAGVTPEEVRAQTPSAYLKWTVSKKLSFDGFYQFAFVPNVLAGCGTFVSQSDYAAPGCDNGLTLGGALFKTHTTDNQSVNGPNNSLNHVTRLPDQKPDNGRFGFSVNYLIDKVGLVGIYYADYTSRMPSSNVERIASGVVVAPGAPGNTSGTKPVLAANYAMAFAPHIRMWGLNYKTRLPDNTGIYAEYTYRPDQAVSINAADILAGELAGAGPLHALAAGGAGSSFTAYDRFKVMQLNLGAGHPFGHIAGGDLKLSGEIGIKHVLALPDTYSGRRYGRADVFGEATSQQTPTCGGNAAQCATDGFATPYAWGYRLRLEDKFAAVATGLELTPSLTFAQDVKGYSYDQVFSEGRKFAIAALGGTIEQTYTFNLFYDDISGGSYNVLRDRSFYGATVGVKF